MELINRDDVIDAWCERVTEEDREDFLRVVRNLPTIQLVNCKDCFHGREIDGEWVCMFRGELVKADGYCHKVELRGEE